jgi:hypothetical protein
MLSDTVVIAHLNGLPGCFLTGRKEAGSFGSQ